MFLKTSDPCLVTLTKTAATLVRLRSSSRVPFINHSTLVIVTDEDAQLYTGLPPRLTTLPPEPVTRNQIIHNSDVQKHTI